jgi:hypothetical protein
MQQTPTSRPLRIEMGNRVQAHLQAKALGLVKLKNIFYFLEILTIEVGSESPPENTAFPQAQGRRADSCNIQSDPVGDGQAQRSPTPTGFAEMTHDDSSIPQSRRPLHQQRIGYAKFFS